MPHHYLRDLLTKVSKASQPWVATMVRTISGQPDAAEVHAQLDHYEHCGHATACSPILAGVVLVRG